MVSPVCDIVCMGCFGNHDISTLPVEDTKSLKVPVEKKGPKIGKSSHELLGQEGATDFSGGSQLGVQKNQRYQPQFMDSSAGPEGQNKINHIRDNLRTHHFKEEEERPPDGKTSSGRVFILSSCAIYPKDCFTSKTLNCF